MKRGLIFAIWGLPCLPSVALSDINIVRDISISCSSSQAFQHKKLENYVRWIFKPEK